MASVARNTRHALNHIVSSPVALAVTTMYRGPGGSLVIARAQYRNAFGPPPRDELADFRQLRKRYGNAKGRGPRNGSGHGRHAGSRRASR